MKTPDLLLKEYGIKAPAWLIAASRNDVTVATALMRAAEEGLEFPDMVLRLCEVLFKHKTELFEAVLRYNRLQHTPQIRT